MTRIFALVLVGTWLASGAAPAAQQEAPGATDGVEPIAESLTLTPEDPSPATAGRQPVGEPGEVFVNANQAYEDGDFARAVELYLQLVEAGYDDGHLHFNLGNAYLRNGELGRAIASYRRSRGLLPRDGDVLANLEFARRSTKDAILPPEPPPVLRTIFFWHYGMSPRELELAVLALNLLFWSVWLFRIYHRDSEVLRWLFILLLILLLGSAASLAVHRFFTHPVAVVVPQEVEARTGPDPEAVVRFKLHAGTEVAVRDRRPDWLRIALPDGQQGWVEEDWLEVVEN